MGKRASPTAATDHRRRPPPSQKNAHPSPHLPTHGRIVAVVDDEAYPMLVGLELDYSFELIGGGFKHFNPNSKTNCGCGKSFKV